MLLEHQDVSVQGQEYRIQSCAIVRLELQSVTTPPRLESGIFAVVTIGDFSGRDPIRIRTCPFQLTEVPNHRDYFDRWRQASARHQVEGGFLDFLLNLFLVQVELVVQEGRLSELLVYIGTNVKLVGRFPPDDDVLGLYFGAVDTMVD